MKISIKKKLALFIALVLFMGSFGYFVTPFSANAVNGYTVTFNSQGGSVVNPVTVATGASIDIKLGNQMPDDPTRSGYVFLGWYTQPNGGGDWFDEHTDIVGDITVHAVWLGGIEFIVNGTRAGTALTVIAGTTLEIYVDVTERGPISGDLYWIITNTPGQEGDFYAVPGLIHIGNPLTGNMQIFTSNLETEDLKTYTFTVSAQCNLHDINIEQTLTITLASDPSAPPPPVITVSGYTLSFDRAEGNDSPYHGVFVYNNHGVLVREEMLWSHPLYNGEHTVTADLRELLRLDPGTYTIRVTANGSLMSNPQTFIQAGRLINLNTPTNLQYDGNGFITWNPVTDAVVYYVEVFHNGGWHGDTGNLFHGAYYNINSVRPIVSDWDENPSVFTGGYFNFRVRAAGDWVTTVGLSDWAYIDNVYIPAFDGSENFRRLATPSVSMDGTVLRLNEWVRGTQFFIVYFNGVQANLPASLTLFNRTNLSVNFAGIAAPGTTIRVQAAHWMGQPSLVDQYGYILYSHLSNTVTMPGTPPVEQPEPSPVPTPSPAPTPAPTPDPTPTPIVTVDDIPVSVEVGINAEAITEAAEIIVDQRTGTVTVEIEFTQEITEVIESAVEAAMEAAQDLAAYVTAAREAATEAGEEYNEADTPEFITVSLNITEMFADMVEDIETLTVVSLPTLLFETIADADEIGLALAMPAGTITFDPGALASAVTQAEGSHISATMESLHIPDIPQNQRRYVRGNETIVRVAFSSGDEAIRNFDGYISVTVPYAGPFPAAVWLLNDDGILIRMPAAYCEESKTVTFQSNRFSLFVIGEAPPEEAAVEVTPPATVTINSRDTASNGAQAVVTVNGSHFINLRYMMEEVLDGMVESTRAADGERLAVFSANHAAGAEASITIAGTYPNATVTATLNETPMLVAARVIDGSWYVILQTFAQMYGFLPELI
ncbi:MAG: InlB B-repeat-containing protein [Defluviitaleaceae bacterium]|nr:InlB B-repeat-containing protein [Defluviitaleaceae bacterium]